MSEEERVLLSADHAEGDGQQASLGICLSVSS